MNTVKFYKRMPNGGIDIVAFKFRQNPQKFSVNCPFRYRKHRKMLPQICAEMFKQGYTRKKLYLEIPAKR